MADETSAAAAVGGLSDRGARRSRPTFVVADTHGNLPLLHALLRQEGIIDASDDRARDGERVIHLGDLCNCVLESVDDDLACLRVAPDWFDVYLVGNHEYPHLGGGAFGGYHPDPEIRSLLSRYNQRGLMKPCVMVDDILVSHAGLSSYHGGSFKTPEEFVAYAQHEWEVHPRDVIFDACGRSRGGWHKQGGILWSDWSEPKRSFRQLVGHSVGSEIRTRGNATCIDLGGGKHGDRLAGAWIRNGQISFATASLEQAAA